MAILLRRIGHIFFCWNLYLINFLLSSFITMGNYGLVFHETLPTNYNHSPH